MCQLEELLRRVLLKETWILVRTQQNNEDKINIPDNEEIITCLQNSGYLERVENEDRDDELILTKEGNQKAIDLRVELARQNKTLFSLGLASIAVATAAFSSDYLVGQEALVIITLLLFIALLSSFVAFIRTKYYTHL